MGHTSKMFFIAGAALGLAGTAFGAESTDTSRAYNNELTADAAGRTSLAAGKTTQGLTITDGSGNFSMRIGGLIQFRYTADFRSGAADPSNPTPTPGSGGGVTGSDKATIGFSLPRTQVYFAGMAGSPELTYYIQGNFSSTSTNTTFNSPNPSSSPVAAPGGGFIGGTYASNNGNFQLEDAYIKYAFDNNWDVRFGQFKLPILTEDLIGDGYQQSIDRSFATEIYRQQRSQGIQVGYTADSFRVLGAISDGWRSANTDYNNANESDYAVTLRVDGKFAGDWNQWNQFSSWQNSQFAAFLGGAVNWQQGGKTGTPGDAQVNLNQANYLLYTIDGQVKGNGWNLYAAFIGSNAKTLNTAAGAGARQNSYAWQIQGGWFATQQIEIFGRYDGINASNSLAASQGGAVSPRTWNFIDFGVNYYLFPESQTAKLSADCVIGLNKSQNLQAINFQGNAGTGQFVPGSTVAAPQTNAGTLGSPKAGEVAIRAQFQLLF
ncbi:MAG: hypothetical protein KF805_11480 [Phycisphaeraceae bacterium]|nr:hypothetical protein [Phycisphaeraceae bacterium]